MKFSMAVLYSSATVKGAILRPVITAHGHFRILKIRYPDVKTHIISHECFLRGAIITAPGEISSANNKVNFGS